MPSARASAGRADSHRLAGDPDFAGFGRRHAEDGLRQFAAPGADEAGEADDFAGADGEADLLVIGRRTRSRTSSTGAPIGAAIFGNRLSICRPTIIWTSSADDVSATRRVPTWAPSRSTVTRSAMAKNLVHADG